MGGEKLRVIVEDVNETTLQVYNQTNQDPRTTSLRHHLLLLPGWALPLTKLVPPSTALLT